MILSCFEGAGGHLQADSPLERHQLPSRYPQIGQREQGAYLGSILGEPAVAHLGIAELPLDYPERLPNLRAHPGVAALPAPVFPVVAGGDDRRIDNRAGTQALDLACRGRVDLFKHSGGQTVGLQQPTEVEDDRLVRDRIQSAAPCAQEH